eukprot:CAMPEP_0181310982 /NCGR_PEP_ID=MMETSP1101-20121128/12887_1 /TAXON_ID=46948 /ORGANISM="Rhodomonas abbreviata, Strain Caron Lab Isolate" /LENGTH=355 /DNA_ID=CAMNT_0023417669 /DNA_START=750 /DNA_END=1813 /DNA_ORIENTATION=+
MKIDHLLSSPRNCFSPRFGLGRAASVHDTPARFTNRFYESSGIKRPLNLVKEENKAHNEGGDSAVEDQVRGLSALDLLSNAAASSTANPIELKVEPAEDAATQGRRRSIGGAINTAVKREVLPPNSDLFPVHLFVAAVGDGTIDPECPTKTKEVLEQIVRKVSKEQNTVVNVHKEGLLHIQLRVFAATSVEAKALKDYIATRPTQSPAPFIVLAKHLPMAVSYHVDALDPAQASIADRLRKQAKTRAIKLLREVIVDERSRVSAAMLRGREGPMVPGERLESLLLARTVHVELPPSSPSSAATVSGGRFVLFPAIIRRPNEGPPASGGGVGGGGGGGGGAGSVSSLLEGVEGEGG